ncbi:MAG: hypothetical protein Q9224_002978, partial [Gallowayella concinna]
STHVPTDLLENQPLNNTRSKSWSNPKKRPSASNLSILANAGQPGLTLSKGNNDAESYPQKRSRAADWPLRSTDESTSSVVIHRQKHKPSLSPGQRRSLGRKSRSSKFLEGSMNDRVSKKPPSIYLQDEAAMEQYHDQLSSRALDSQHSGGMDDGKTYYDAGIETTKPSGMYRFGKAIASAFNPVNVWQGINGYLRVKEEQKNTDRNILDERKIKAERAYAEMKKNGFQGTQSFAIRGSSIDGSGFSARTSQDCSTGSSLRDSGVHFDEALTSIIPKKNGQSYPAGSEDMLIATSLLQSRRAASPIAPAEHGRRTSLNLRRPSFPNLKKVKSHMQLPTPKRKTTDAASISPSSQLTSEPSIGQRLSRQPSKKDIAKQRKLSKQVSNLESKLQTARRDLEISRGQIPEVPKIPKSGRKPFKPGALPSLPSESCLNSTEKSLPAESNLEWKATASRKSREQSSTPTKSAIKGATAKTLQFTGQSQERDSTPTSSVKKRKLSGGWVANRNSKSGQSTDNGSDSDLAVSAKKASCARKAQNTDSFPTDDAGESRSKGSPVGAFRGTRGALLRSQTAIPPVPALSARFDAGKVDKGKLVAMRSVRKDHLPFGSHLDDIVNLQKEFPRCSQKQLDEYLSGLSMQQKAPSDQASPPKRANGEINWSRQACKNPSPNRSLAKNLSTIDEAITMDPTTDRSIPPLPRSPLKDTPNPTLPRASGGGGKKIDKGLPGIQKEDYKWPEDVF